MEGGCGEGECECECECEEEVVEAIGARLVKGAPAWYRDKLFAVSWRKFPNEVHNVNMPQCGLETQLHKLKRLKGHHDRIFPFI